MKRDRKRFPLGAIALAVLGALGWFAGCSDNPGSPCSVDCEPLAGVIVSNPVASAALTAQTGGALALAPGAAEDVAYVSLAPGTVPTGSRASVRRLGDATSVTSAVTSGGFDPVPVPAQEGDSIEVVVTDAEGVVVFHQYALVAASRRPIIVRTDPPPRKRDVPLNASIVIVFSEPIDGATLTPNSVRLLRNGTPVAGTVGFLDASLDAAQVKVAFVPDALLAPGTDYQLEVTQSVRDRDGEPLAAAETVSFRTGTSVTDPPVSISFSVDTGMVLVAGATFQMTATVRDAAGNELIDQPVTWSTSDPNVLAISPTGLLTCVGDGYAFVVASVGGVSKSTSIRVTALPPASVTVAPATTTVGASDTVMLTATVRDAAERIINHPSVTWTSSAPAVATVATAGSDHRIATVTAVSLGSVTITASSGTGSATSAITIGPQVPVASVTVTPPVATVVVQGTVQLAVTLRDASGKVLLARPTAWTSDNAAVATVDTNGLVTAAGVGSATVTATSEGMSGTAMITVTAIVFQSLSANYGTTCGLTAGGAAYCWGYNATGQLGNGTTASSSVPVPVTGGLSFTLVTTGENHTCGLTASGAAYCWGWNRDGALGDGSTTDRLTPVPVAGGLRFTALSAGFLAHTCGLTASGAAYCWGRGEAGELGNGLNSNVSFPVPVAGGLSFTALTAGDEFSCGLVTSGAAFCWGANFAGQLGNGSTSSSSVPVGVAGGLGFTSISTQYLTVCGITASGAAYCWGSTTGSSVPVPVIGGLSFSTVSPGDYHVCGLTTGGAAYCWGDNLYGQLGVGSNSNVSFPVPVAGGLSFTAVRSGGYHGCGISTSGVAYCWGNNLFGQLGDGSTLDTNAPVKVAGQP